VFRIYISKRAATRLRRLPISDKELILKRLEVLSEDPFHSRSKADIKKLKGGRYRYYRLRVGDYHIVYETVGDEVRVRRVIHRKEGYDWLE